MKIKRLEQRFPELGSKVAILFTFRVKIFCFESLYVPKKGTPENWSPQLSNKYETNTHGIGDAKQQEVEQF
jgi:hypothetical protein